MTGLKKTVEYFEVLVKYIKALEVIQAPITCECSSMVELQPSKLTTWVRFPSLAPGSLAQLDRATAF